MTEKWWLATSTLLALAAMLAGVRAMWRSHQTYWTLLFLFGTFLCQFVFLHHRGELRAACPLRDPGEILAFLAWSLTFFYIAVGRVYRLSLVGLFTAPLVAILQIIALIPGVMEQPPEKVLGVTAWGETHAAVAVLAYGAFALAAVTGVMFLVLDHLLKTHDLKSSLYKRLPPVRELLEAEIRLLWIGLALLTVGLIAGWLMPHVGGWAHFIAALAVWLAYGFLLGLRQWRGVTGRKLSWCAVIFFLCSLVVFGLV